jgi:penicillin-binding protein 1A
VARPDASAARPGGLHPPAPPGRLTLRARVRHALVDAGLWNDRPRGQRRRARAAQPRPGRLVPRLRPAYVRRHRIEDASWGMRAAALLLAGVSAGMGLVLLAATLIPAAIDNAVAAVDVELQLPEQVGLPELDQRSVIYAGDGSLLAVLDREVSRSVVSLDRVPPHVQHAVITAEDRKFFEHEGYDVEGIGRALVANAKARGIAQGGSTITQQLAKTAVGNQRTFDRKVAELAYAVALENRFPKEVLLERYLNLVYFGSRAYGIAAAAEEFFAVSTEQLTVEQAALLAGLIRSPNTVDPRTKPDLALARRNQILAAMAAEGYISPADVPALQATPLGVVPPSDYQPTQPHVVDSVEREFLANAAFGATPEERLDLLYSGGLEIHTTLDPRLQAAAHEVIATHFPTQEGPTAAIAAVEPVSGRILAVQGGLDYAQEQYDLATQGRRQPGSAFKPFVYAEALRQGFPISMRLNGNDKACYDTIPGWNCDPRDPKADGVRNYGFASYGTVDMRTGLTKSINTATAQLMVTIGADDVTALIGQMGVDMLGANPNPEQPSEVFRNEGIALGGLTNGVTTLEMASAYSTFANNGVHVRPYLIERVTDRVGNTVYTAQLVAGQVLEASVNAAMVSVMQDVVRRGTGTRARLPAWEVAGKTGTTTDNADAWFVGYTPVMSTAVWMGHPDEQVSMRGVTGGSLPATMWREFMTLALEGRDPVPFPDVDFSRKRLATGERVEVPDVRDLQAGEALRLLGDRKLVGEVRLVASRQPDGTVVWQSPRAERTARAGDTVYIGVSSDRAPVEKATSDSSSSSRRARSTPTSAPQTAPAEASPADEPEEEAAEPAEGGTDSETDTGADDE